jgi:ClpP class serine protease
MMWLLAAETAQELNRWLDAGIAPTVEQEAAFTQRCFAQLDGSGSPALNVKNGTAEIAVDGVLTERPSFLAFLFGGGNTSYLGIRNALAKADADPTVREARFTINSPGGEVSGLFETLSAVEVFSKPKSVISSKAASAAYAIASAAGAITATNSAAQFGSIGVVQSFTVDAKRVDVTSTDAPNKRPDVTTEEGKAVVRAELDAVHELFVEAIARGRKASVTDVNTKFGRGGIVLARTAKQLGMIDAISGTTNPTTTGTSAYARAEENPMTGKTYDQLTTAEKHELWRSDPALFNKMAAGSNDRYVSRDDRAPLYNGRRYEQLAPMEKHRLQHSDPKAFASMRADWQSRGEPSEPESSEVA